MSGTVRLYIDGKLVSERRYKSVSDRKGIIDRWKPMRLFGKPTEIGIIPDKVETKRPAKYRNIAPPVAKQANVRPKAIYSNSGHLKTIEKYG